MPQANPGSSSEQKPARRTSPNSSAARSAGSARSSPSRSGKTSDSKPERSRSRAKSAGRRAASSKGTANASRRRPSQATAAAGLVGGVILGTRLAGKPRRVLGVPVPGTGRRLSGLVGQVGKASKQFKNASKQVGELTNEVRAVREKAEEIGRAIS
jgi:hypothetical protein